MVPLTSILLPRGLTVSQKFASTIMVSSKIIFFPLWYLLAQDIFIYLKCRAEFVTGLACKIIICIVYIITLLCKKI